MPALAFTVARMMRPIKVEQRMQEQRDQAPAWVGLMEAALEERAKILRRPGIRAVDIGLMAGAVVFTCYRDTQLS